MSNTVTLGGNPIEVGGKFLAKGDQAPAFSLVGKDLADVTLASLAGKRKVLNIFPSIDTPTCATSVRKFNAAANELANTVVLCISADLPFAQARFCGAEGLANVQTLSTMRSRATCFAPAMIACAFAMSPSVWSSAILSGTSS